MNVHGCRVCPTETTGTRGRIQSLFLAKAEKGHRARNQPSRSHTALGQAENPSLPTLSSAPPAPSRFPPSPSSGDTWMPSQKPPQWRRCKYFPLGLQVRKIPFLPRSFRQFTLPFSKQIFILIKAFITIIHLSLHSIRQLQSTDGLSHHETFPSTLVGGRGRP